MNTTARMIALTGSMLAFFAVAMAAMGSHLFDMNGLKGIWQIALNLHFFNAAGLLGLAALLNSLQTGPLKWGAWMIVFGTLVFCGSIYVHVIAGLTLAGVTPAGGMLMMAGWLISALAFIRR